MVYISGAASASRKSAGSPALQKILPAAFVLMGCWLSAYMFKGYFEVRRIERLEQAWPAVDATIASSTLVRVTSKNRNVSWEPAWSYTYVVNGKAYLSWNYSTRYGYVVHTYQSEEDGNRARDTRLAGQKVTVYYDPENPARSALDRRVAGDKDRYLLLMPFVPLCLFSGVGFLVFARLRSPVRK